MISCGADAAPPLLLIHGSGSNSAMWIADAAAWASHYRVYAVDLIGEPGSSAPARPPLKSSAYTDWLGEVLVALSIDRVAIMGVSLGGWVALDYATRHPTRVDRLVLLAPGGIGRQRLSFLAKVLPLLMLGSRGRKKAMSIAIGPQPAKSAAGRQKYIDFMLLVQQYFRARMQPLPVFSDASLQKLIMPVLAVLGAKDAILDSAHTKRRLASNVPHSKIQYLDDVGHGIFGEKTAILEFLDRQTAARR